MPTPEPDFEIKRGDTWPPLYGTAAKDGQLLPIETAQALRPLIRNGSTLIGDAGTVEVLDPPVVNPDDPDGLPFNWRYLWAPGDTAVSVPLPARFHAEFEITWQPEIVQTVPPRGGRIVQINPDLG
jgi:hypothetical protein